MNGKPKGECVHMCIDAVVWRSVSRKASAIVSHMTYWTVTAVDHRTCVLLCLQEGDSQGKREREGKKVVEESKHKWESQPQINLLSSWKDWRGKKSRGAGVKWRTFLRDDWYCLMLCHVCKSLRRLLDFIFHIIMICGGHFSNLSLDFMVRLLKNHLSDYLCCFQHPNKNEQRNSNWLFLNFWILIIFVSSP